LARNFFIRVVASAAASPPGADLTRLFLRFVNVSSMYRVRELRKARKKGEASAGFRKADKRSARDRWEERGERRKGKQETNLIVEGSISDVFWVTIWMMSFRAVGSSCLSWTPEPDQASETKYQLLLSPQVREIRPVSTTYS
jgi:hypothetical protein